MGEKRTVRWVYCGKRLSVKGETKELHFCYVDETESVKVNSDGDPKGARYFGKALGSSGKHGDIVGGIYEGTVEDGPDGSLTAYNVGSWSYKGYIEDGALRASLKALDDAVVGSFKAWKRKKEDKAEDPLLACLEPVRAAYKKTNTDGKRALLAKVLEYVSR